jgi:hypothetical protein
LRLQTLAVLEMQIVFAFVEKRVLARKEVPSVGYGVVGLKRVLRNVTFARTLANLLVRRPRRGPAFTNSHDYWESRYRSGRDSGAGSYNRLARFKADYLNAFVREQAIQTVIEFGTGDGAQLALASYPSYIGVDVSRTILAKVRDRMGSTPGFSFLHTSEVTSEHRAELALSLDVVYHLIEDDVFDDYMRRLFDASTHFVIVYSSNVDRAGSAPHVRHRHFSRWVQDNRPDFTLFQHVPNAYPYDERDPDNTSFAEFYLFCKGADAIRGNS